MIVEPFEFIVIDDGSTDGSLSVLRRYAARDPRIRLVSRENRGLVATLNEGIALARGQWIARMDADDVALPDRFEVQLERLQRTGADFCGDAVECFGEWRAVWRYPLSHDACEARLLMDVPFAHPTVIGRRSAFADLGYDSAYTQAQDYDLWQRAWARGYKLVNVPDVVLRYRVHAGQVSARKAADQQSKADSVRKRHWQTLLPNMAVDEIARIIEMLRDGKGETGALMSSVETLLTRYAGDARETLLFDCYRAFCRLAGNDPAAARNWLRLASYAEATFSPKAWARAFVLATLSLFKVKPYQNSFRSLKKTAALFNALLSRPKAWRKHKDLV
ncbi:glycosyltransferase [Thermosynechococcus sp. TG252]|uniref:glycosyltransferase family 2 protein n=1 Tax=Thermosynechococcus sp. TG252 TaxID=3074097 RepID=UPI00285BEFBB|nr:glycosyltransferase [Thermosynechococcus sp. TG252]MDR7994255.1 glycosyltransferase [Thermosynechococcus sp. TG252]